MPVDHAQAIYHGTGLSEVMVLRYAGSSAEMAWPGGCQDQIRQAIEAEALQSKGEKS